MGSVAEMTFFRQLHHVDQQMTLAVNSVNSPWSDLIWMVFSNKEIWFALYAVVLFFFFKRLGWRKAVVVTLACVLTIVACDQFANFTKNFFERLRPCWDGNMTGLHVLEDKGGLYGFYSAHAANAMGFAVSSYRGFKNDRFRSYNRYKIGICIWAFLVGISRVFVGKHFLGDVMVGLCMGVLFAWIISGLGNIIIRRFNL